MTHTNCSNTMIECVIDEERMKKFVGETLLFGKQLCKLWCAKNEIDMLHYIYLYIYRDHFKTGVIE